MTHHMVRHSSSQGGHAEPQVDVIALALVGDQAQLPMHIGSRIHS